MAYSTELRVQALRYCLDGYTLEEAAKKFDLSKHTVKAWRKLLFDTGSLDKKKTGPKQGTVYRYKPEKMKELLDKSETGESAVSANESGAKNREAQSALLQQKPKEKGKKKNKYLDFG